MGRDTFLATRILLSTLSAASIEAALLSGIERISIVGQIGQICHTETVGVSFVRA